MSAVSNASHPSQGILSSCGNAATRVMTIATNPLVVDLAAKSVVLASRSVISGPIATAFYFSSTIAKSVVIGIGMYCSEKLSDSAKAIQSIAYGVLSLMSSSLVLFGAESLALTYIAPISLPAALALNLTVNLIGMSVSTGMETVKEMV